MNRFVIAALILVWTAGIVGIGLLFEDEPIVMNLLWLSLSLIVVGLVIGVYGGTLNFKKK